MHLSDSLISSFEAVWGGAHKIPRGALPVCIKYLYNIHLLSWAIFLGFATINLELFTQGNNVAERDLMFGDDCVHPLMLLVLG